MADVKKNKFTYDRNYYENMSKHVSGTAAKALDALEYEEDFFEDGEIFDEEYSEYDFETSPKKKEPVQPAIRVTPERHRKEKVKVRYKFNIVTLMMIVVSIVALVGASYKYIEVRADIIQANKKISAAQNELKDIQNKNNALLGKLDVEMDRNYIYAVAVEKLGMRYPKENDIVYYEKSDEGYVRQYHDIPEIK
ncbi:MAG: hypothetical protein K5795_02810 [Lachnospiraceae bacterium]|nr:hypothetical protein [Lachnospiraceae bacterium]